jgi:integrase
MAGSRILTPPEVKKILRYLKTRNQRDYVATLCSVTFGLRIGELLRLTFKDIEGGDYIYIRSLKNSNNENFPIPPTVDDELKRLKLYYHGKGIDITSHHYLFQSQKGENQAISREHFNYILRTACKKLKIGGKVSNHSLRKCYINTIYQKTQDVFKTKVYSRHKSIQSLQSYVSESHDTSIINLITWS